jgi:hypothetical protein
METIVNTTVKTINVEKLKSDIKELAEKQKFYRNQRKTEYIVGERKMQPWEAACAHRENRNKLRIMYAVYGVLKGKKFSEIENHYQEDNHPLKEYQYQIDKLMKTYEIHE